MVRTLLTCVIVAVAIASVASAADSGGSSFARTVADVQPKIVKIYGAGGVRGLEPYQSGFLISDEGHILTVWSYVLDTDYLGVTLNDGQKFEAKLLGADPRLELAILKIEAKDTPHFKLSEAAAIESGSRVLAFSNLFGVATGDEPASVQHGIISVKTRLDARRGTYETPYHGTVYVLDAMTNNPGAAGGALTDQDGRLVAMLGKELRNALNNTWLNYAVPIDQLTASVDQIMAGKFRPAQEKPKEEKRPAEARDLERLGVVLVPDVLERTPPFIDTVRTGSAADKAGLKADDLIVFVGDHLVHSCRSFREELADRAADASLKITVLRGQELIDATLTSDASEEQEGE